MASPTTIAFAGSDRFTRVTGPPAVPRVTNCACGACWAAAALEATDPASNNSATRQHVPVLMYSPFIRTIAALTPLPSAAAPSRGQALEELPHGLGLATGDRFVVARGDIELTALDRTHRAQRAPGQLCRHAPVFRHVSGPLLHRHALVTD